MKAKGEGWAIEFDLFDCKEESDKIEYSTRWNPVRLTVPPGRIPFLLYTLSPLVLSSPSSVQVLPGYCSNAALPLAQAGSVQW